MNSITPNKDIPVVDADPYADDFLINPYPYHQQLRKAGPVVWLPKYQTFAMAGYHEVKQALKDWQTFCSSRGVGLSDFAKEEPWRPPSLLLEVDPPFHTKTRSVVSEILSRPALETLRAGFTKRAENLVEQLLRKPTCDGVEDIAKAFPLTVFPDAVGVRPDGRENLLPYGDMAFNAFGPRNQRLEDSREEAVKVVAWITEQCKRDNLTQDGLGAQIYSYADNGDITHEEAGLLVRSLLTAGLDTTIFGIANTLLCFANNPDQWRKLAEQPALMGNAFDEVLRYASPAQTFYRTITCPVEVSGSIIPEGAKVLLFLGAANRDGRVWDDPEAFDITRKKIPHVGFGFGVHMCVGQMLARLETEILFAELAKHVERIELTNEPKWWLNNTLRGLAYLPLKLHPKVKKHSCVEIKPTPPLTTTTTNSTIDTLVSVIYWQTPDTLSIELQADGATPLPKAAPGSHIDMHLGNGLIRQYSLCCNPNSDGRYRIAIRREDNGRGGSRWIHDHLKIGQKIRISHPRNLFPIKPSTHPYLLLGAGIGITPLLSMAYHLSENNVKFSLHYCTKSKENTAFYDELQAAPFSKCVTHHFGDDKRLQIRELLQGIDRNTEVYFCGPTRFMEEILSVAEALHWPSEQLHFEYFQPPEQKVGPATEFTVELKQSGKRVTVKADESVLDALERQGILVPKSCEQGVCGSCVTRVLSGTPDHRDHFLTNEEKASNQQFTPCCSRSLDAVMVLDL